MENSNIEWTNHTFNPWWGCMKVSEGCKNCYAETLDNRYNHSDPHWGPNSPRKPMSEAYWKKPIQWNKEAEKSGIKAKVFCASMADVFEDHADVAGWRIDLFYLILNTPNLIWQLLTKRPENIEKLVPEIWLEQWPDNVWIGTSVENQAAANARIPYLLQVPALVHFISCEPLLGPVDLMKIEANAFQLFGGLEELTETFCALDIEGEQGFEHCIDWVIVGGESGDHARPMYPDFASSLRDKCKTAGVAFFFKQWGEYQPTSFFSKDKNTIWIFEDYPGVIHKTQPRMMACFGARVSALKKIGKKLAGALLDGKEYKQFPLEAAAI